MDSFLLKNKSEFAKAISKSKLMERSFLSDIYIFI